LCFADRDAIAHASQGPYVTHSQILILKVHRLQRHPEIDNLVAVQTFKAVGRNARDGKVYIVDSNSLTDELDAIPEFSLPHAAAENCAAVLRQAQCVGEIGHDSGDNRDLGTTTKVYFRRRDSSAIYPNERIGMASQQSKLPTREGSSRVCLVLSKDRNEAIFILGRGIGMDEPLNEPEDADVAPNPKRDRQQKNERKPGRTSKRPRRLADCQQPV
jgi:hypothetical protein